MISYITLQNNSLFQHLIYLFLPIPSSTGIHRTNLQEFEENRRDY